MLVGVVNVQAPALVPKALDSAEGEVAYAAAEEQVEGFDSLWAA